MYESIKHALETLEKSGYRVIVFAPNVIEGVDKEVLDNACVEAYWGVLEDIGKDTEEAERIEKAEQLRRDEKNGLYGGQVDPCN